MAITQGDVDKAKVAMLSAQTARDNEWNGTPTNSTGYSVISWMSELQKCNGNAYITRDSIGNITSYFEGPGPHDCSNSVWNNRKAQFQTAKTKYESLQNDYIVKKNSYDSILADFVKQGPALEQSSEAKKDNAKTALIVIVVIVVVVAAFLGMKKAGWF